MVRTTTTGGFTSFGDVRLQKTRVRQEDRWSKERGRGSVAATVIEESVKAYRCERCSYEWIPCGAEEPRVVCPKCKNPYWNGPRREHKTEKS